MDEKKKETPLVLRYEDGRVYTLEFSRDTVALAGDLGFKRSEILNNEMKQIPILFFAAFKMHHPEMTQPETDKILFEDLGGMTEAISDRLIALYTEPYNDLFNETGEVKNPKLTVVL